MSGCSHIGAPVEELLQGMLPRHRIAHAYHELDAVAQPYSHHHADDVAARAHVPPQLNGKPPGQMTQNASRLKCPAVKEEALTLSVEIQTEEHLSNNLISQHQQEPPCARCHA